MPHRTSARTVLFLGSALTLLCFFWIDRPASTWSHAHLQGSGLFYPLVRMGDAIYGLALCSLAGLGAASIFTDFRPGPRSVVVLRTALAVFVAETGRVILGVVCGRTCPETFTGNPSWIRDGAYGFHLLHGGEGWTSFPSGHTAAATAFATALWYQAPRLRILWALIAVLIATGLYGADYHFLGDIAGGATLGILSAQGVLALAPGRPSAG